MLHELLADPGLEVAEAAIRTAAALRNEICLYRAHDALKDIQGRLIKAFLECSFVAKLA